MTIVVRFDEAGSEGEMIGKLLDTGIEPHDTSRQFIVYRPAGLGTFMKKEIIHGIPINGGIKKFDASQVPGLKEPHWIVLSSGAKEDGLITKEFHQEYVKLLEEFTRMKEAKNAAEVARQIAESELSKSKSEIIKEETEKMKKLKEATGFPYQGDQYAGQPSRNVVLE